jgi:hypothetical protein
MTIPQTEPPPEPIIPDPEASRPQTEPPTNQPRRDVEANRTMTEDELVDEQGEESFPASDPPAY